ncbi:MAG: DUF721 domain-containing protein [Solirubrobacterales bacterium]
MPRRRAPRRAAEAMRAVLGNQAPRTTLAAVQAHWAAACGEQIARFARPVREQSDGTVVVACESAVWAAELDGLRTELLAALRTAIGESAPPDLRFVVEE